MNIPSSLLSSLRNVPGFDREAFVAAHEQAPPVSVRRHPIKGSTLFPDLEVVQWCPKGIYLPQRPVFTLDPAFHAGAYYVQEASSMFLHHALLHLGANKANLRVLDLCAAPGGKSTLIADILSPDSLLISNEVIRSRAAILEENIARWGYMNTWVTSNDPRDLGRLHGYFDIIVVDAPCSGSGLWRKDANALNEWSEANVALCAGRQQRILADIWPALKTGGLLVYATCSYSHEEDEDILGWLAKTYDVAGLSIPINEQWGITPITSGGLSGYRFFPGKVKGEGFFLAAMRKQEEANSLKPPKHKATTRTPKEAEASASLLDTDVALAPASDGGFSAVHPAHAADIAIIATAAYLRRTGTRLGAAAGKDWIPDHDVALSIHRSEHTAAVSLNMEQALRFLKREDPGVETLQKGWHVVTYGGNGLGWIKAIGNRVNNYLPKHWRIRMNIDGDAQN